MCGEEIDDDIPILYFVACLSGARYAQQLTYANLTLALRSRNTIYTTSQPHVRYTAAYATLQYLLAPHLRYGNVY